MSTAPQFDPYREWLGIEPHEQPADYYRLLGVARFEPDAGAIAAAADRRMALVRTFQVGPRGMYTQRLLNEIAAARVTLITPQTRAAYDAALLMHRPPAAAAARAAFAPYSTPPEPLRSDSAIQAPPVLTPAVPPPVSAPAEPPLAESPPRQRAEASQPVAADSPAFAPPSPWRPLLVLMGVPTIVLLAVIAWALSKPYLDAAADRAAEDAAARDDPPPSEEPPPQPVRKAIAVLQEGSGEVLLTPATAALHGPVELAVSGTEEVLIGWSGDQAEAEWRFRLIKPGFFQAEATYALSDAVATAELDLVVGEKTQRLSLRPSGGLDRFHTDRQPIVVTKSGENSLRVRPAGAMPTGEWLVLKSVRLVPALRNMPAEEQP